MKSLLILVAALSGVTATSRLTDDPGPIQRVVDLIKDLRDNLKKDQKAEQKMFDKYACWCEETTGKKAKAIEEAHEKIQTLSTTILKLKGTVAVRAAELEELAKKIAENEESQKSATAVREKEHNTFITEKVDLEQAITALEKAIVVLGGKMFLQGADVANGAARQQAVSLLSSVVHALPARTSLPPKHLAAIESVVNLKSNFKQPEGIEPADASASHAPQSATIQGILKDMYDTMTTDLETLSTDEASKQRKFEDFIAELKAQLRHMKKEVEEKEAEKAEASVQLAEAMQILDELQKQMDADIEFFDLTKAACKAKDEEWKDRKEAREEELEGIKKALEILTSDDAKELFGKAIKPGKETMFLQLDEDSSLAASAAAMRAYNVLKAQAQNAKSLRLAALAATVRTMGVGHFDKVIKEIDKMIEKLKEEEKEDIEKRDDCKDEYHKNAQEKANIKWKIERNEATITKLEKKIEKLDEQITQTVEEIETTEKEIKEMEDTRKDENEDFKQAKQDDEDAIKLLGKAVDALSSYYKNNKIEMGPVQGSVKLLQEMQYEKGDQPDAKFSKKGSRKNESKGIISILTMLMEDLEDEIKNGIKNEVGAQGEFEKRLDAAKKLIEKLEEKKMNLKDDKASAEEDKADEEAAKEENEKDLSTNEDYKKDIEPDCDWMLDNFEERIEMRRAEMAGLVKAKEYLAGAKVPELLETSKTFDDSKFERISFESLRR